ncbi:type II toxin-antitoxin system PemK/MazF family toxin [Actinomadura alba]|uniref:Type II toxin-antitoxin system PemK/MazF family toxin n=1 Tax=Actinomadura alba TaxID=406431 RepID=A0ABR7LWI4_9ACTN|nr:type II toxin-antitoxin system PemK/MazF family toxin [Actinomadura alba]MBC6468944.1 type II toxin-antitoxin system PemK/MazF family toxin [Actinomadura alba]
MRGDVYRLRAARDTVGHEQKGHRFAVIVQSDFLSHLSTVLVAPTSTSASATFFRPDIELNGRKTRVMVEQTAAIDPMRLGAFAGRLSLYELDQVDTALRTMLALPR